MSRKSDSVYSEPRKQKNKQPEQPASGPDLSYISPDLRALAVPIETLVLDPHNVNKHGEKSIDGLKGTLEAYGQRKPLVLNTRTGYVEAGNGVLEAARALGWTHLAVSREDDDEATAKGYALVDNQVARLSMLDKEKLKVELHKVSTKNDPRLDQMLSDLSKEKNLFGERDKPPADKKDVAFQADAKALELIVTCKDEAEQEELLKRLRKEGYQTRKSAA